MGRREGVDCGRVAKRNRCSDMEDKNGELWVVQANTLVEHRVRESIYRLSLADRRLLAILIAKIDPFMEEDEFPMMKISVAEYQRINGLAFGGGKAYEQLKKSVKTLMGTVIEWPDPSRLGRWKLAQILSEGEYVEGEGWMEVKLHEKLKPVLLGLKSAFSKYKLEMVGRFSSLYGLRLFEMINARLYQSNPMVSYSVPELRERFGIEKGKLSEFGNFRKRVLDIAIRQVKEEADIHLEYKLDRKGSRGNSVNRVIFIWNMDKSKPARITAELSREERLYQEFKTWAKPLKMEFWNWYVDHQPNSGFEKDKPEWRIIPESRLKTVLGYYMEDQRQGKLKLA